MTETQATQKQKTAPSSRMNKRVETKEDGRFLIYYTFTSEGTKDSAAQASKGESKK